MTGRGLGLLLVCAVAWAGWTQVTASLPAPGPVEERIAAIRKLMDDGKHLEAERRARAELAALEAAGEGESGGAAKLLDCLAEALWVSGKAGEPETRSIADRALRLKEKIFGPEHPEYAESLRNLATVLGLVGDQAGARPLVERALAIERKALGPEHPTLGRTLDHLAILLFRMGDFAEAKKLLEEALALSVKTAGPESSRTAQNLNDLAVVQWKLGEYEQAKRLHERALAIREKTLGPDHFQVAASLNNLALVLGAMNDLRGALALHERALRIREKSLGPEHPNIANGLSNVAWLHSRLREFDTARAQLERALAIREKAYGPRHPEVGVTLENLAVALRGQGDRERALDAALRSEEIAREHLRLTIRTLAEREATASLTWRSDGLGIALAMIAAGGLPETGLRRTWDALIRSRALVFDEMSARRRALAGAEDAETAVWVKDLDQARRSYARLLVQGPGKPGAVGRAAALDGARRGMERAERALAERSRRFRNELAQRRGGVEEVAAALPAGSALVSYVLYRPDYYGEDLSYFAFVLRGGEAAPAAAALAPARHIDALVAAWRAQIAREAAASGRSSKRNERECRLAGLALRRAVWDPVAAHLSGAKRVFLVLDGALHLVNFAALPSAPDRYLVEQGPLLHILNAERDLIPQETGAPGRDLLAVGDPDFDLGGQRAAMPTGRATAALRGAQSASCAEFEQLRFERLAGSAREAGEVAAIWEQAGNRSSALREALATKAAFIQAAPGKRVLHLATHGFFLPARCGAKETRLPVAGLALAGANRRGAGEDPGILTAEEVASLRLDGVDWVVLSGCDTALGTIQAGEGVFGLRRSFQQAGARTVVMSLWPVQDQAARQWMVGLYRARFLAKLGTPESVRRAGLELLHRRRAQHLSTHPFYWAGFVAAGDWK